MMWSWVLAIIGVTGIYFVGRKTVWAWFVLLFNECLWIIYAITTKQYGFIFASLAYSAVYIKSYIHWSKEPVNAFDMRVMTKVTELHIPVERVLDGRPYGSVLTLTICKECGQKYPCNTIKDIDSPAGYSTGKWSDDDDAHPTITPIFGPNR